MGVNEVRERKRFGCSLHMHLEHMFLVIMKGLVLTLDKKTRFWIVDYLTVNKSLYIKEIK